MIWITTGIILAAIGYAIAMIGLLRQCNREAACGSHTPADLDEAVAFTEALNGPLSR